MKKTVLLLFSTLTAILYGATGLEDVRGFTLQHVKIPLYNQQRLQLMIFADKSERQERLLLGSNTLIDLLLDGADVDKIVDGWDERLYPLYSPLSRVVAFWARRYRTSNAVLFTSRCTLDQQNQTANGSDPVFVRSPMLDLNGIGFHCDFRKRTIDVSSGVKIVGRTVSCDPRAILDGTPMPKEYNTISAESDSLRIDLIHDELMLIGNVKVIDADMLLTCDRLTLFLNGGTAEQPKNQGSSALQANERMLKGVSRILADGDVVIRRFAASDRKQQKPPLNVGTGEHLEYIIASGKIILTGEDDRQPVITQQNEFRLTGDRLELLRFAKKSFVSGHCRIEKLPGADGSPAQSIDSDRADFDGENRLYTFFGNVVVNTPQMTLRCDRMRIFSTPKGENPKTPAPAAADLKGGADSPDFGKGEVNRIFADGRVRVDAKTASGSGTAADKRNLTAERGEWDYGKNKLVFHRNVVVTNNGAVLKCERLDLFLADKSGKEAAKNGDAPVFSGPAGSGKSIRRVTAEKKVLMTMQNSEMTTDFLTLDFRDLPKGAKSAPGMFQSGGVQLVRILADGSVAAQNQPVPGNAAQEERPGLLGHRSSGARRINAEHAIIDLLRHRSEFHEKVRVRDDLNELNSRDLYVFTGITKPGQQQAAEHAAPLTEEESIDADPYALEESENSVPAFVALSDDLHLRRVIAKNDVVITRKNADGTFQQAGGDNAVYTVTDRKMILTAERPRRPYLRDGTRKQFCDEIHGDTESEELRAHGNIEVMPDR